MNGTPFSVPFTFEFNLMFSLFPGNYPLYLILSQGHYELRVDLADHDGNTRYALYKIFQLGNSADSYRLFVSGYSGDAGLYNEITFD